jgi:phosphoglycerate dehydrogenase-like enzyme/sugar phosphate isomerase/epimerase
MHMKREPTIYMSTVALDPTRWGRRQPSFAVSEWLPRFANDGFDGVELWEFHYLKADAEEQARMAAAAPVQIYNSYVGFGDDEGEARTASADAITKLKATAVKYNLGGDATRVDEYRRNLLAWAAQLPAACQLLCECHPGTVLENVDDAVAFFADLDPARFGVIAHISGEAAGLNTWFRAFNGRIQHLHVQMRGPESDPTVPANRVPFDACFSAVKASGFAGTVAIEFSRGIGRNEDIEIIYKNACVDMAYCREALGGEPGRGVAEHESGKNGINMLKIRHITNRRSQIAADGPFAAALRELGELELVEQVRERSDEEVLELMRGADVLITNWATRRIPDGLAEDPGRVRYILNIGGTCNAVVPIEVIRSGIPVTNWGDTPARAVAEGAMSLLLAVLKDLRGRVEGVLAGKTWGAGRLGLPSGSLCGLKLGLYGCGVIGQRFVKQVAGFEPELIVYDPFVKELPDACRQVDSLDALFGESEAVVIWAGLSDDTRGSVNAELLAKLPDHAIIVNAARGEIIDQDALFAELKSGRLRAGLDVLVGDNYLEEGNEAHTWPNLLITCHDINSASWPKRPPQLGYGDKVALDNLKRFIAGEPLKFVMDEARYKLSS